MATWVEISGGHTLQVKRQNQKRDNHNATAEAEEAADKAGDGTQGEI